MAKRNSRCHLIQIRRTQFETNLAEVSAATEKSALAELVGIANSEPARAIALADEVIDEVTTVADQVMVLRAKAIALRVVGDIGGAAAVARHAMDQAIQADEATLAATAAMTLAPMEAMRGQVDEAFDLLDSAETLLAGVEAADVQFQRGGLLCMLGDFATSIDEYSKAIPAFRTTQNATLLPDALMCRGAAYGCIGETAKSFADLNEARQMFVEMDDSLGVGLVAHNVALARFTSNDPARAVVEFDNALALLSQEEDFPLDSLRSDQCDALIAAGLIAKAIELGQDGIEAHDKAGNVVEGATQRLALAHALHRSGDLRTSQRQAEQAHSALRAQGQLDRADQARLLLLRIDLALDRSGADVAQEAGEISERFRGSGHSEWRAAALLVEALGHAADGDDDRARNALDRVARQHHSFAQELERLSLEATIAYSEGRRGAALRYCRRAVRTVHVTNTLAGSMLVRSAMSRHLDSVVAIGVIALLDAGRARGAMCLVEEAKGQVGRAAPSPFSTQFADHRALTRAITEASNEGRDTRELRKRRRVLEDEIRSARTHVLDAAPPPAVELAKDVLVRRYVSTRGSLVALDLRRGRVRAQRLADLTTVSALINELSFRLGDSLRSGEVTASLRDVASELDLALGLPGELARSDTILNVIPAAELPSLPLRLLPSLASVPWANAQRASVGSAATRHRSKGDHVAVAGAGLAHARAEIKRISIATEEAMQALRCGATCADVLTAMNDASFVHVAAHSSINPGNLMFSSIQFADGDLSLHELEGIENPPATVVLASCDSAATKQVGTASLGLATGLLAAGIQTVVGTGCAIPDNEDTVAVMVHLHECGVISNPVDAVHRVATSPDLTDYQRLIAQCLVVCTEHPISAT